MCSDRAIELLCVFVLVQLYSDNPVIIAVSTSCVLALQTRQECRCVPGFVYMHPYTCVNGCVCTQTYTRVCVGCIYQQSWQLRAPQHCPAENQRCLLPSSCPKRHMNPVGRKEHVGIALQELFHFSLMPLPFSSSPKANKLKDFWKIIVCCCYSCFYFWSWCLNTIT